MKLTTTYALVAILLAAPEAKANTAEHLREALSACGLPGADVAARVDRLSENGWRAVEVSQSMTAALTDALLIANPPDRLEGSVWQERRQWAASLLPAFSGPPGKWLFKDGSWIRVSRQDEFGNPTCFLVTRTSSESDRLFDDLSRSSGAVHWGFGARGEMFAVQPALDHNWRTDIALTRADATKIDAVLSPPLAATLAVTFVTRPLEVTP